MAKIIKFSRKTDKFFVDYDVSTNCCNDDSFGVVCVKCGRCGRKFVDGILEKGGVEE